MNYRYFLRFVPVVILVLVCHNQDQNAYAAEDQSEAAQKRSGAVERDFYFPNMDIRSAFKAVATAAKIDIVLSPNIAGRVNVTLTGKNWKQAMEVLCQMFDLQYTIEDEYIYIQSLKDYNASTKEAKLIREIIKIKHTKVKDIAPAVTGLLSERGKITVVEKSNALIVYDIEQKMTEIKKTLFTLDVEIFQVHIQAQILEISTDAAQQLGINWSAGTGTGPQMDIQRSPENIPITGAGDAVVGKSSPGRVAGSTMSLGLRLLDGQLGVAIEHLLSEGKGEVVAKPQITTLDNTEARIFIGERRPFLKLDQNLNSTTEFVDAGVELIVTPHITNENRIIIDLKPQRSNAITDPVTNGPIVTTTEAKTTVVVNDGETVVIGGLTSKIENQTERGVPLLKDIPLLGALFRYKSSSTVKKDLVIFITPYIIKKGMDVASTLSLKTRGLRPRTTPAVQDAYMEEGLDDINEGQPDETEDDEIDDENVQEFLDEIGK